MIQPPRLNLLLSFALVGAALWLWTRPNLERAISEPLESGLLILDDVNVLDPDQGSLQTGRRVVIHDGLIASIAAAGGPIPTGALLPKTKGLTLVPGLVDCARFLSLDGALPEDRAPAEFRANALAAFRGGTLGLLCLNNSAAQRRDLHQIPVLSRPRILLSGSLFCSPGGWRAGNAGDLNSPTLEISDGEGAQPGLSDWRAAGLEAIFASMEHDGRDGAALDDSTLAALATAARDAGRPLVLHAEDESAARAALRSKPTILLGPLAAAVCPPEFFEAFRRSGAAWAPMLASLSALEPGPTLEKLSDLARESRAPRRVVDSLGDWKRLSRHARRNQLNGYQVSYARENLRRALAAGVPLVLGSGGGLTGLTHGNSADLELEALRDAGVPPLELLRLATRQGARTLGFKGWGSLSPGSRAELLLLDGDPLQDPSLLGKPLALIRGGKLWRVREL